MNWDELQGRWTAYRGKAQEKWGKLTNDDLDVIAGRRDQFIGRLQERYGLLRDEAEKQVDEFAKSVERSNERERERIKQRERARKAAKA